MKKLLLLCSLSLLALGLDAQNHGVAAPGFGLKNLTNGYYQPNSNIHFSTPNYMGSACQGETHHITLVPSNPSDYDGTPDHIITPLDDSFDVTIVNSTFPEPASVTFNQSGEFYFSFSQHIGIIFYMFVYPSEITITPSDTSIYIGQPLELFSNSRPNHWSMGDGATYTSNPVIHTYENTGEYTVSLDAGKDDCQGQDQITVTVLPNQPQITLNNPNPCFGDTILLTGSCPYEEGVQTWQWEHNGQTIGFGQQISWAPNSEAAHYLVLKTYDYSNQLIGQKFLFVFIPTFFTLQSITGPTLNCGQAIYEVENYNPYYQYNWSVSGGTISANNGSSLTVEWSGDNAEGHVYLDITDPSSGCDYSLDLAVDEPCCADNPQADYVLYEGDDQADLIALNGGSNSFQYKTIVLNGSSLPITNDSLYFHGCHFQIIANGQIDLDGSDEPILYANKTTFESCQDSMWKGIKARQGKITLNACIVKEAAIGLDVKGHGISSTYHSRYEVINNKFYNNYTHMKVSKGVAPSSTVYGNTFSTLADHLLYPYQYRRRAKFGILLYQASRLTIGSSIAKNTFTKADFGIFSFNSSANVHNNTFYQLVPSGHEQGLVVFGLLAYNSTGICALNNQFYYLEPPLLKATNNTFSNNGNGIYTTNTRLIAEHNEVYNHSLYGIYSLNTPSNYLFYSRVYQNTISSCPVAIYSFGNKGDYYCTHNKINDSRIGIRMVHSSGHESINNNCIEDSYQGLSFTFVNKPFIYNNYTRHIKKVGLSLSNISDARVFKNTFQGSQLNYSYGIHSHYGLGNRIVNNRIQHFERCAQFNFNNQHTTLRNNLFLNGKYGVFLANKGIIGPQGSPEQAQDNRWPVYQWQGGDKAHLYTDPTSYGLSSPFYYRCTGNDFMPAVSLGDYPMPTIQLSSANLPPPDYNLGPGSCNSALGINTPIGPAPVDPTGALDFLASKALNTAGLSLSYNPQDYSYQQALSQQLSEHTENLTSRPDLQNYLQVAQNQEFYKAVEARQLAQQGNYRAALHKLEQWNENHPIARTTKAVRMLLYQLEEQGLSPLQCSPQEQDNIRTWARLCPYSHGPEVYMARAMAQLIDAQWQDYSHDCESSAPPMAARLSQETGLSLYPNPSSGFVRLEAPGVEVWVHDLLGQTLYRAPLQGSHSLFLQDWPQGVYVVKSLAADGQVLGSEKLIKIRK